MGNKERQPEKTILEKSIWWTKVGGILAAVIGYINHLSGYVTGGTVAFIGAELLQGQVKKIQKNAQKT